MVEWRITIGNFLEKRRIKVQKKEDENFQYFMQNNYRFQILITKTSIISDNQNPVFILIYTIFPQI